MQFFEIGNAVVVDAHCLAVNCCRVNLQSRDSPQDPRKSLRPIVSAASKQSHPAITAADNHAITVPFNLMNPLRPAGRICHSGRQTRFGEADWKGTLQHLGRSQMSAELTA